MGRIQPTCPAPSEADAASDQVEIRRLLRFRLSNRHWMSTLPSTPSRASVANAPGSARGWGREEGGARTAGLGGRSARPASELLGASQGQSSANFATPESERSRRWNRADSCSGGD